jgi:hypothetical protein
VVEVIERLDLSAMVGAYRGSGSASYHPSVLWLLVWVYGQGVFSRALGRATDSVAVRFILASTPIDDRHVSKRFLGQSGRCSSRC